MMPDFIAFIILYSFLKLLRIMTAATVFMTAALIICHAGGSRRWGCSMLALALVPLAVLTGYSRIFYEGRMFLYSNWLQQLVTIKMAVCYFGIAGIPALRYALMCRRLRRSLKSMQRMRREEYPLFLKQKRGTCRIQVYLTKMQCSPFAGGLIKPYIVVPEYLKETLTKEEFYAVLYHEAVHIRQGHVFLLNIYALLKILWWVHPLVYILDEKLRENMEYSSDEISVTLGPLDVCGYAGVMLKTVRMKRQYLIQESITAFSGSCFTVLKKRMERLAELKELLNKHPCEIVRYKKRLKTSRAAAAMVIITGAAAVIAVSVPRYTVSEEIAVYDEDMNLLTYDLESEGFQAEAANDAFFISPGQMNQLAAKYKIKGNYAVFSYGTIMKVPGCGGLGQAAYVNIRDTADVSLLGRQEWTDELKSFILKYLI